MQVVNQSEVRNELTDVLVGYGLVVHGRVVHLIVVLLGLGEIFELQETRVGDHFAVTLDSRENLVNLRLVSLLEQLEVFFKNCDRDFLQDTQIQ